MKFKIFWGRNFNFAILWIALLAVSISITASSGIYFASKDATETNASVGNYETDSTTYYQSIDDTKTGNELLGQLHDLSVDTHQTYPTYSDLKNGTYVFNMDPGDSGYARDFYTQDTANISVEWSGGATGTRNREHVWCQSYSNGLWSSTSDSTTGGGSDFHHVRPIESTLNSTRNNHPFGIVSKHDETTIRYAKDSTGQYRTDYPGGYYQSGVDVFEPIDAVKGDVARILMYVYMHYSTYANVGGNKDDANHPEYFGNLDITDIVYTADEGTAQDAWTLLINWSDNDPVDEFERNRNNAAASYQGNRNPFIDHPEYARAIWGSDSKTTVTYTFLDKYWHDSTVEIDRCWSSDKDTNTSSDYGPSITTASINQDTGAHSLVSFIDVSEVYVNYSTTNSNVGTGTVTLKKCTSSGETITPGEAIASASITGKSYNTISTVAFNFDESYESYSGYLAFSCTNEAVSSSKGTYYFTSITIVCSAIINEKTVSVTSVEIDETANIQIGDVNKSTINYTVLPEDATNQSVTWASSNTDIATVDENGYVTGVSIGEVTITVTTVDGDLSASCNVKIEPIIETLTLVGDTVVPINGTSTIQAVITPTSSITTPKLSWSSSNTSVATVNDSGEVSGVSFGTATITCTTQDGSDITRTRNIVVSNKSFAYFEKVTDDQSDWTGTYLLVNEEHSVAFDSTLATSSTDDTGTDQPHNTVDVDISNNRISLNDTSFLAAITVSKYDTDSSYYCIQKQDGAYIKTSSSGNFFSSNDKTSYSKLSFGYDSTNNSPQIEYIPSSKAYRLYFYTYSSYDKFRFKDTSGNCQQIQLYKLVSSDNGVSLDKTNAESTISHSVTVTATTSGSGTIAASLNDGATASYEISETTESNVYNIIVTPSEIEEVILTVSFGGFDATCVINFTTNVDGVSINTKPSGEKAYQSTYQLSVTTQGDGDATGGKAVYSTSDKYVITVSSTGLVYMAGGGTAVITVTYGTATDTCTFKVKENTTKITVEATDEERDDDFVLVTSSDDLVVGGTYIIASSLYDVVMDEPSSTSSSYMSTSYGEKVVVKYTGTEDYTKVITNSSLADTAQVVTLETGSIDGTYCFKTADNKYIYANNGGMNTGSKDQSGIETEESLKVTIYFTNSLSWETVYAYCYNDGEYSDSSIGEPMTFFANNEFNQGVYTFNFNQGDYDYIRFTAGKSSTKTVEISLADVETNDAWVPTGSGSPYEVNTYTFTDFITVYYLNSNDWSGTMQFYYGSGDINMTFIGYNDQTKAVYYCNLPTSATYVHFYNGSKCSTDIQLSDVTSTNNMFYADGTTTSGGLYNLVGGEYKATKKCYFTKPSYFGDTIYVKAWYKDSTETITKYNSSDTYGVYAHYEYLNDYGEKIYSYSYVAGDYNWLYWNDGTGGHRTQDLTQVGLAENQGWYSTTFEAKVESSDITALYFKNTDNWSTVYAHLWDGTATGTSWPGMQMTQIDATNDIWCIIFNDGDYGKVIFNNNNGSQTADLTIGTTRYWVGQAASTSESMPYKAIFLTKYSKYPFSLSSLKCYASTNNTDFDEFTCYEHNDLGVFYAHVSTSRNYTHIYFGNGTYSTISPEASTTYNHEDKIVIGNSYSSRWTNNRTTIYFTNQWDWSDVYVMLYETSGGSGAQNLTSPGAKMTWAFNNDSGKGVYKYTFVNNSKYKYIKFNNGSEFLDEYELSSAPKNGDAWYPEWTQEKGNHALPWTYTGGVDKEQTGYVEKYVVTSSRCSWNITIDSNGGATIAAAVSDASYKNVIRYLTSTASSDAKFTTYLSGAYGKSTDVVIYKLVEGTTTASWEITYQDDGEALHFAHEYGSKFEEVCDCVTKGTKTYEDIEDLWITMQEQMLIQLTPVSIAMFTYAERNVTGDTIQAYLAKCAYILNKYDDLSEIVENDDNAFEIFAKDLSPVRNNKTSFDSLTNINTSIVIVTAIGILSLTCLGSFYIIRKKKEDEKS